MIKRHRDLVLNRLDQLYANGMVSFSWLELEYWFNTPEIKKAHWKELKSYWEEVIEDKDYIDPLIIQNKEVVILYLDRNLSNLSEKIK